MRFLIPACLVVTLAAAAGADPDRPWPVPLAPAVSSNFCEYRDGRFHAGIDVRTYGREGIACRAVGDGWISRVRASSIGYGKALHLTLAGGEEAVYAHLAEFAPALEESLAAAQAREGRYNVDFPLPAGAVRVRRGEVIAYSGATGASAPHLHFETRAGEVAVNPFRRGFSLADQTRPSFSRVAFLPLSPDAAVEGACYPLDLVPRLTGPGRYVIEDTLRFAGEVGVAASVIDRLNSASGRLAPYELQVWVEGVQVARIVLDRFGFTESGEVDLLYHAGANRARGVMLYELYRRDGETLGGRTFARGGRVVPVPPSTSSRRVHAGRVVALDVAGNRAEVEFFFTDVPPPSTPRRGHATSHLAVDVDGAFFGDGFAIIPVWESRRMLRERGHDGLHEEAPGTMVVRATELAGRIRPLARVAGGDTATVYLAGIARGGAQRTRFAALDLSLEVGAEALYTDAVVYATRAETERARATAGLEMRSAPVRVGPVGWVTKKGFTVRIDFPGGDEKDAIFRFDDRTRGWTRLATTRDATGLSARAPRPGVFAVMRDETPPWLGAPQLAWPESYATGVAYPELRVPVEDRGAGIDDARILVTVAGVERYARWDFAKKKIIVALRGDPIIGSQPVHVVVFDRAGNQSVANATVDFDAR